MKLAIFNPVHYSANSGGPKGYLYNLYQGFGENKPDFLFVQKKTDLSSENKKKERANRIVIELRAVFSFLRAGLKVRKAMKDDVGNYDIIHVHSLEDVLNIKFFCRFKGKVILTPHRPDTMAGEKTESMKLTTNGSYWLFKKVCNLIERTAYKSADAFIFPSLGAKSIYENFPGFKKGTKGKHFSYLFTGIIPKDVTLSRVDYRKKHGIPFDAFVVAYVGRHNYIKGYDRLVSSFEQLKQKSIWVVVCGGQSTIVPPTDDSWIELGYINDSQNLINAADVLIVPNRCTYFDLVIIEALALGKIVITSNTGGNTDIAPLCKGLLLFDNEESYSWLEKVYDVQKMSCEEICELEKSSLDFYKNNCTAQMFASMYLEECDNLMNVLS